jgi:hypothetical protein
LYVSTTCLAVEGTLATSARLALPDRGSQHRQPAARSGRGGVRASYCGRAIGWSGCAPAPDTRFDGFRLPDCAANCGRWPGSRSDSGRGSPALRTGEVRSPTVKAGNHRGLITGIGIAHEGVTLAGQLKAPSRTPRRSGTCAHSSSHRSMRLI